MFLNPDLWDDLLPEFIPSFDENLEFLARFMLSGKESVHALRRMVTAANAVELSHIIPDIINIPPTRFSYVVKFGVEEVITISRISPHPRPMYIFRWALSSVRTVEIDSKKSFPRKFMDLILKNPNFKELIIGDCHLSNAKLLLTSKKFERVVMSDTLFKRLKNVYIEADVVEIDLAPIKDVLKSNFIKTDLLVCRDALCMFKDDLTVDVSPAFESLENFKIDLIEINTDFNVKTLFGLHWLVELSESVDAKLNNLKLLTINISQSYPRLGFAVQRGFRLSVDYFSEMVDYVDEMTGYNGRTKVQFNHKIFFRIRPSHVRNNIQGYVKKLKEELRDFEYSSQIKDRETCYIFKRSKEVTEKSNMFNPDLYEDLCFELISLLDGGSELLVKFMLSGRESMIGSKKTISKARTVELAHDTFDPMGIFPPIFFYIIKLGEDACISVSTMSGCPHPMLMIRWALSSTGTVVLDSKKLFPKKVIDCLLRNSKFKRLILEEYNLSIAKRLLKSRKFEFVEIGYDVFYRSKEICVDTEELEFDQIPLKDILKSKSIKTKSLICKDFFDQFDNDLAVRISPNFALLEKLEINLRHMYMCCSPQIVLESRSFIELFELLNTKLVNLNLLTFTYNEYYPHSSRDIYEDSNLRAKDFNVITGYQDNLIGYNGRAKVKFNHTLFCDIVPSFDQTTKDYIEELKNDLRGFEYSFWIEDDDTIYSFKKSKSVSENFEVNLEIRLAKQLC
ncbi:hypothetical protein FO519_008993 [Halicephalobus sp. NKZ332]|nr:hypothetical protein FO519_008993 [Halicephalobus sp. NKZ332]